MSTEKDFLVSIGMPESVARREAIFKPSSVGVIIHTGDFDFEERRRKRSGEPEVLLVRQAEKLVNGFHPWGIPAGKAEDEGIIEVAEREVCEETYINLEVARLKWFCPSGDRKAILSYQIGTTEIPRWQEAEEYELGIKVIPPDSNVNPHEIDKLALVPVEVFFDHMLVGSHRVFRKLSLLSEYVYFPKSERVDENIDFVPAVYKSDIWQAIRHQMFVRKILPSYLG
jgi:8-oxo-dGTP pyrophosphatase MutT (NUDIX family)